MKLFSNVAPKHRLIFLVSFAIALLYAGVTNHVWEDYYITYRASKNLATGHGLVFNHGDRLHTFTSPLGVLLPALASALTLNTSDTAALWIFRIFSAAALAGAVTLLYACVAEITASLLLAGFGAVWLMLDAKAVDFSINGMETAFLLLFVAGTFRAQFGHCTRRWLWLGLGWAGIMWTRPDGFLYIGLLSLGGWIFNDPSRSGLTRMAWLKVFAFAALVCTAVYLPWFIGSWAYYGTPVPHTIRAKAAMATGRTLIGALKTAVYLPRLIWTGDTSAHVAFLPSYYIAGGWPTVLTPTAKFLAFIAAFTWVVPRTGAAVRTASFAFFGLHVYLTYYPYFPFPWYLPGSTLLAYFVFAGLLARLDRPNVSWRRYAALAASVVLLSINVWMFGAVARQVRVAQLIVEDGNRRKIGEWLREHAEPGDRVFMEPLGYIGFFSGLKPYDFPGMSSREMVEATTHFGDWPRLIQYLQPEWVILRPIEANLISSSHRYLLTSTYRAVREFDVLDAVKKLNVHGRPNLEFDARFTVYRRERPQRFVSEFGEFLDRFPPALSSIDGHQVQLVHAPGTWIVKVPKDARHVRLGFGYLAEDRKSVV